MGCAFRKPGLLTLRGNGLQHANENRKLGIAPEPEPFEWQIALYTYIFEHGNFGGSEREGHCPERTRSEHDNRLDVSQARTFVARVSPDRQYLSRQKVQLTCATAGSPRIRPRRCVMRDFGVLFAVNVYHACRRP